MTKTHKQKNIHLRRKKAVSLNRVVWQETIRWAILVIGFVILIFVFGSLLYTEESQDVTPEKMENAVKRAATEGAFIKNPVYNNAKKQTRVKAQDALQTKKGVEFNKADIELQKSQDTLKAKKAVLLKGKSVIEATGGVSVRRKDGTKLDAEKVVTTTDGETVKASGGVKIKDKSGVKIQSETITAKQTENTLQGKGNVKVESGKSTAKGNEVFFDKNKEEIELKGNVNIVIDE